MLPKAGSICCQYCGRRSQKSIKASPQPVARGDRRIVLTGRFVEYIQQGFHVLCWSWCAPAGTDSSQRCDSEHATAELGECSPVDQPAAARLANVLKQDMGQLWRRSRPWPTLRPF